MQEAVVEVPRISYRGLKVYLESQGDKEDELNVKYFVDFIEHHTGHKIQDSSFYHLKAKQFLGTG